MALGRMIHSFRSFKIASVTRRSSGSWNLGCATNTRMYTCSTTYCVCGARSVNFLHQSLSLSLTLVVDVV